MDPINILGAVAAASKLLSQALEITRLLSDLCGKVKEAPDTIRKQIAQVQQLVDLARLVTGNPALQKDSIASILHTCLGTAAQCLTTLKKASPTDGDGKLKKAQKVVRALMKENEIARLLEDLEREKASLVLCIHEIDSEKLHSIHIQVDEITTEIGKMTLAVNDTACHVERFSGVLPELSGNITNLHRDVAILVERSSLAQSAVVASSTRPDIEQQSYWIVPNRRIPGFIGREEILMKIQDAFNRHKAEELEPRGIFWIDATSRNTALKSFEAVARRILLPSQIPQQDAVVESVKEKLAEWSEPWLLVFDNYDNPDAFFFNDYKPSGGDGCVLITTRHADVDDCAGSGNAFELSPLSETEAVRLLLKLSQKEKTGNNLEQGKKIAERLGYHPLAITQAGSYIKLRKIRVDEFMDHYNRKRKDILQQRPRMTPYLRTLHDSEEETALSVFTTWELSLQQLRAENDSGDLEADVLTLFAFLGGKDLSAQLFEAYCSHSSIISEPPNNTAGRGLQLFLGYQKRWDADNFESVVIDLSQTSLVQAWSREPDGYCHVVLYPLIEDWIMLRVDLQTFWKYHVKAAEILAAGLETSFTCMDFRIPFALKKSILSRIDLHLEHGLYLANQEESSSRDKYGELQQSHLWFYRLLDRDFRSEDAESLAYKVFEWRERVLGPEHELTVDVLFDISDFRNQAVEICRRYVRSCETLYGHDHILTFRGYWSLCSAFVSEDQFGEAKGILDNQIKPFRELFGLQCPDTCFSLWIEGAFFQKQERYWEAEVAYRQTLDIADKILFPGHFMAILAQRRFAEVLKLQGKEEEARDVRQLYAEHLNNRFNPTNSVTVELQIDIASDLFDQEKYIEAEMILRPLFEDKTTSLSNTAFSIYSDILLALDKYEEAEELFLRQLATQGKKYGPESLEAALVLEHLAIVLRGRGRLDESVALARKVLAIRLKETRPNHPNTFVAYQNLSFFLQLQENYSEAIDILQQCYKSKVEHLGRDQKSTVDTLKELAVLYNNHGVALVKSDEYLQGLDYLQQAYEVRAKHLGQEDERTRRTLQQISVANYNHGLDLKNHEQYREAVDYFRICYKLEVDVLKKDTSNSALTLRQIHEAAAELQSKDRFLEALEIYEWVAEAEEKHLGPDHTDAIATLLSMQKILNLLERSSQAETIRQRIIKSQEFTLGPASGDVMKPC
ncbi:TPR-like protein [Stipitochalara longipes BDJ]|nr:TPR-like protein [Stipitochalara longipes BDJ]